jgi:hypothetical protein
MKRVKTDWRAVAEKRNWHGKAIALAEILRGEGYQHLAYQLTQVVEHDTEIEREADELFGRAEEPATTSD